MRNMSDPRCSATVPTAGMMMHYHNCLNKAKVTRDGKPYCAIHDPIRLSARTKERQKKWDADWARKTAIWDRESKSLKLLNRLKKCPEREISEIVHKWRKLVNGDEG